MLIDPSIPEIQLFQNLSLKIQGQGHGRGQSSKPQSVFHFLLIHIPFVPCKPTLSFLWYGFFNIWPWKSMVISPWCCTIIGLDNFTELRTVQIHPVVSEIQCMCSAKYGPQWYLIWKVFGPWASPYGANGQITMTLHNCSSSQFHKT